MSASVASSELEAVAARVAHILGPQSSSARALDELHKRRESGERVDLFLHCKTWFVVPTSWIEVRLKEPKP